MVRVAIVCEGRTDKEFIEKLLIHLGVESQQVQFYMLGGKSNIFNKADKRYNNLLLEVRADQISKVLFVVDADNEENDQRYGGYENSHIELTNAIQALELQEIRSSYIMRDPTTHNGYLESLILATISESERNCLTSFLDCSRFKSKENHKAILNEIYKLAYPDSPYDFGHTHFDELKNTLKALFS